MSGINNRAKSNCLLQQTSMLDTHRLSSQMFINQVNSGENSRIAVDCFLKIPLVGVDSDSCEPQFLYSRFHMSRSPQEPVSMFANRLVSSLNKCISSEYINRKRQRKLPLPLGLQVIDARLSIGSTTTRLADAITLNDALFASNPSILQEDDSSTQTQRLLSLFFPADIQPLTVVLQLNVARIYRLNIETIPLVGCPVIPVIEADDLCLETSDFEWCVGELHNGNFVAVSEPCHTGLIFRPAVEHVGKHIQLRVRARNAQGQLGLPFGDAKRFSDFGQPVVCKSRVSAGPLQLFHQERARLAGIIPREPNRIRVVSYNLLADMYASTESAKNVIFRHCPLDFLDIKYRLPLILRELISYQADFLCLQEVDAFVYSRYLVPVLQHELGMTGLFLSKRKVVEEVTENRLTRLRVMLDQDKLEGCAIFYNSTRLELLRHDNLPSLLAYASTVPHLSALLQKVKQDSLGSTATDPAIAHFPTDPQASWEKSHSHCLITGLFRLRGDPSSSSDDLPPILVGNTHFYFHPTADGFRRVQAASTLHYLTELASRVYPADTDGIIPPSNPQPIVILAGDINQNPDGPAYKALVTGHQLDNSGQQPGYSLQLESAFEPSDMEFTNWVPGFHGKLDVILYNPKSGLKCTHKLPVCSCQEVVSQLEQDPNTPKDIETRGNPVNNEDRFSLPNAHFPSDHISLVADFDWFPPS